MAKFIFMLTQNEMTIVNAYERYQEIAPTEIQHIGFKDVGIGYKEMNRLADCIKADGKTLHLEVVSLGADDELKSVRTAIDLGVDYLLGGTRPELVGPLVADSGIIYCPFPGTVTGHPSILSGRIDEIARDAKRMTQMEGVSGVDLLAYRHSGNVSNLINQVVNAALGQVIIAGSINSVDRIKEVGQSGAWAFTIGSALLDGSFLGHLATLAERIRAVLKLT